MTTNQSQTDALAVSVATQIDARLPRRVLSANFLSQERIETAVMERSTPNEGGSTYAGGRGEKERSLPRSAARRAEWAAKPR